MTIDFFSYYLGLFIGIIATGFIVLLVWHFLKQDAVHASDEEVKE